jgi:hypothetical protein
VGPRMTVFLVTRLAPTEAFSALPVWTVWARSLWGSWVSGTIFISSNIICTLTLACSI